jgi:transcriptional regulator with XRE-family HTH domain
MFVCVTQTASVTIMATGRIELGPTGINVAANVKRLREAQGLSLRALSLRLKGTDRELSADALNKIENGANPDAKHIRRVDADDLTALAVVLGVSPSALMLPLDDSPGGVALVTGVGEVPADRAWDWVDGRRPLHLRADGESEDWQDYFRLSRPTQRRRREQLEHIRSVMKEIDDPGERDDG